MDAERRQVTVLFADMVGFTSFSERSGEEAAYTFMRSLSKLMDDAVHEQGGVVRASRATESWLYSVRRLRSRTRRFGRVVRRFDILQRLKTAGPDLETKHGVRPQLRIGLNTGAAVVGKVEAGADAGVTVLGDTVNFAARLQALAEPNSVFVSEATHRLVQGLVDESFAGEHIIKGKAEPQKVYRLDGSVREQLGSREQLAVGLPTSLDVNTNWRCWRVLSMTFARSFAWSTLLPNRAWGNHGFCTNSVSASARNAPLSSRGLVRLTASRRRSSPLSR